MLAEGIVIGGILSCDYLWNIAVLCCGKLSIEVFVCLLCTVFPRYHFLNNIF